MNIQTTDIEGLLILEPTVFADDRGFFMETYQTERYTSLGIGPFVQDNWSRSKRDTLRGLHLQHPQAQGKLVMVMRGTVWDVAVDLRRDSPTFGRHVGVELSDGNRRQFWIPAGFAHGFCVLSDEADFVYKCSQLYSRGFAHSIHYADPELAIAWPVERPILSPQDEQAPNLGDVLSKLDHA